MKNSNVDNRREVAIEALFDTVEALYRQDRHEVHAKVAFDPEELIRFYPNSRQSVDGRILIDDGGDGYDVHVTVSWTMVGSVVDKASVYVEYPDDGLSSGEWHEMMSLNALWETTIDDANARMIEAA